MIKILHLYYDLLNLYGDNGNIKALCLLFDSLKIKYQVDKLSILDDFNPMEYSFIYIGSGTEKNQKLALNHLLKYKESIYEYINKSKVMLITGNSIELFGKSIDEYEALNLFDYTSSSVDYRIAKEVYIKSNVTLENIVGFINQNSISNINDNHIFDNEGYRFKNFYATNILGPILVRNPHLLLFIAEKILNTKLTNYNLKLETNAYNDFISKYNKNKKA